VNYELPLTEIPAEVPSDIPRTLPQWLDYILTLHPVGWDLGLERVGKVAKRLDVTHPGKCTILVAGTNGKGSTCEYLEAFAQASGLSVGKATSPHIHRFNERIELNCLDASDEAIIEAFEIINEARGEITLTYFEFAALAAMVIFKANQLDVAILEVGLGGRLDAMNVTEPDLTIITSISLDHEAWLGNDREAIAAEKAGIMRPNVPCLIADRDPPSSLRRHAAAIAAPTEWITEDFEEKNPPLVHLPLDSYIVARRVAQKLDWDTTTALQIAADTTLAGRRTWLNAQPCPVLVDVAHNPAAAAALVSYLDDHLTTGDVHVVLGMYEDKDIEGVTGLFSGRIKTWHLAELEESRGASSEQLFNRLADEAHGNAITYANIPSAVEGAQKGAKSGDIIVAFGSFPLVAGVLRLLD
jgi:dihydrofolate synthase/folylpolyglutamate synthase